MWIAHKQIALERGPARMDGDGEARTKGYEELPRPKQRKKEHGKESTGAREPFPQ